MLKNIDEKQFFTINDLNYLYQYIILNYDDIKFYKNVFFLIVKKRDDFFDFISTLDKEYINKTSFLYVTEDFNHNSNIFDTDSSNILGYEINKELIDFLKIKIDNGTLFERIDYEYNKLFKSKGIIFFIFVIVLYLIIYMLGNSFSDIASGSDINVDVSSVLFFYENNFILTMIFFFVVSSMHITKYIKHNPLYQLNFSKYYVLLKYKEKLYSTMLNYFIDKGPKKDGEIGYLNPAKEFFNVYTSIFEYISKDEIGELLFFLENDQVAINLKNPILKQDIINDYKNFKKIQNNNVKQKINFYKNLKERNKTYHDLLKLNFEKEFEEIKEYMNFKGLVMYIFITFTVIGMITPLLLSAL